MRLIVEVPLSIGAVGDMDDADGKSGVVSDLSPYGRLEVKQNTRSPKTFFMCHILQVFPIERPTQCEKIFYPCK